MQMKQTDRARRPAVFLDRDGVLTKEEGYITNVENLHIFPYTAECIRQIHEKGYYAIVITNQSGVARGFFTEKKLMEMNDYLMRLINVDAVYYCPHHFQGKIVQYRKVCHCRKPETGLFEKACEQFNVDMQNSYMVGDRAGDIIAGQNAGVKTILLESGYGTKNLERKVCADYVFEDLQDVIKIL